MAIMIHFQRQTSPRAINSLFCYFRVLQSMRFLLIQNFDVIFAKNLNRRQLRPDQWSKLVTTAKTTHFKGQTSSRAGKPLIYQFSSAQSTIFFSDLEFRCVFAEKLHEFPFRPYLQSQLVTTTTLTHFQGQTSPRVGRSLILPIFMCYKPTIFFGDLEFRCFFLPKIYMYVS